MNSINKKEIDQLISICNTNPDSKVIFACIGDTDFRTMAKSFTKKESINFEKALHSNRARSI